MGTFTAYVTVPDCPGHQVFPDSQAEDASDRGQSEPFPLGSSLLGLLVTTRTVAAIQGFKEMEKGRIP